MTGLDLARTGYEAYAAHTNWKNFRGDPMPQWTDLPEAIQAAWRQAALSIIHTFNHYSRTKTEEIT